MSQRMINDTFWTDPYIEDLNPSEKLVYLYLLTNPICNIAGAYEIKMKRIAYETGFDKEMIDKILSRFVKDGKIIRWNDWVFIINFIKNQSVKNPSVTKGIQRILDSLPIELLTACIHPVDTLSHLTLLNLTLPNLTSLNSTEISEEDDFPKKEGDNFSPTETSLVPEESNIPPELNIKSTIDFVKKKVEEGGMLYACSKEEGIYARQINVGKDFGENASRVGKSRLEFVDFIIQCSMKSKFWRNKLNNSEMIYTHYAKVFNEVSTTYKQQEIITYA